MSVFLKNKKIRKRKEMLIIVESPFQLLCAYEFIKQYSINYKLYIRLNHCENNNAQLKHIVERFSIKGVHYFYFPKRHMILLLTHCIRFLFCLRYFKGVVIGNYQSVLLSTIVRFVSRKKVWLLDDGTATFTIQKQIEQEKKTPFNLYTILPINALPGQKIEFHSLRHVKELMNNKNFKTIKSSNIFIGGNLVDVNVLKLSQYLDIIQRAESMCQGGLLYIAHRGSSKKVLESIKAIDNVDVVLPSLPIECYLLEEKLVPVDIFSVFSTAVYSLAAIYSEIRPEIIAFKPNFRGDHVRLSAILSLYNHFEKSPHIKVIEIL